MGNVGERARTDALGANFPFPLLNKFESFDPLSDLECFQCPTRCL